MHGGPILTLERVATSAGVSISTVRRWLLAGSDPLPYTRVGRWRIVVRPDDLVAWARRRAMHLAVDPHDLARPWETE